MHSVLSDVTSVPCSRLDGGNAVHHGWVHLHQPMDSGTGVWSSGGYVEWAIAPSLARRAKTPRPGATMSQAERRRRLASLDQALVMGLPMAEMNGVDHRVQRLTIAAKVRELNNIHGLAPIANLQPLPFSQVWHRGQRGEGSFYLIHVPEYLPNRAPTGMWARGKPKQAVDV